LPQHPSREVLELRSIEAATIRPNLLAQVSTVTAIPDAALLLALIGSGRRHWVGKYELHRQLEEACKSERKRERWVIFSSLNGIDRLARDLKFLGQFGLGPVALGAQNAKAVIHFQACTGGR
jgi:hypothetical protein